MSSAALKALNIQDGSSLATETFSKTDFIVDILFISSYDAALDDG